MKGKVPSAPSLQFAVLILGSQSPLQQSLPVALLTHNINQILADWKQKGCLHSPCGSPKVSATPYLYLNYMLRPKCNSGEQRGKLYNKTILMLSSSKAPFLHGDIGLPHLMTAYKEKSQE